MCGSEQRIQQRTHACKWNSCHPALTECQGLCRSNQVQGALDNEILLQESATPTQCPGCQCLRPHAIGTTLSCASPATAYIWREVARKHTGTSTVWQEACILQTPRAGSPHTPKGPHHTLWEGRASQRGWDGLFPLQSKALKRRSGAVRSRVAKGTHMFLTPTQFLTLMSLNKAGLESYLQGELQIAWLGLHIWGSFVIWAVCPLTTRARPLSSLHLSLCQLSRQTAMIKVHYAQGVPPNPLPDSIHPSTADSLFSVPV